LNNCNYVDLRLHLVPEAVSVAQSVATKHLWSNVGYRQNNNPNGKSELF